MPAIYDLANRGLLPPGFSLVGFAVATGPTRTSPDRARLGEGARPHGVPRGGLEPARRGVPVRARRLRRRRGLRPACAAPSRSSTRSAAPAATTPSTSRSRRRSSATSSGSSRSTGWPSPGRRRLAPGRDREAVRPRPRRRRASSTTVLDGVFPPESIFRIDHYLGKETVQNILAMRFANTMFEPLWNSNYVDHVQITMAEDIGIGGRAGYYDGIGAARDVIQNHLLQLMALVAMEEPISFDAESLRIEKLKVLKSVVLPRRLDLATARGQYAAAGRAARRCRASSRRRASQDLDHRDVRRGHAPRRQPPLGRRAVLPAHRQAAGPAGHRGGGRLQAGPAPAVQRTRHRGAHPQRPGDPGPARRGHDACGSAPRCPAPRWRSATSTWTSPTAARSPRPVPEAYERLILDVLLGDPPLFPRHEEVELSWQILDPILEHWARKGRPSTYASGTWGPESADPMLARDGRTWRRP